MASRPRGQRNPNDPAISQIGPIDVTCPTCDRRPGGFCRELGVMLDHPHESREIAAAIRRDERLKWKSAA